MNDITKSPMTRGNLMGGALLMQIGFSYVVSFALTFLCLLFDRSGRVTELIANNDIVVSYALNTFIEFVTFFVFFIVIIKALNLDTAQTCALGLPDRKGLALPCIFISLSMCLLGSILMNTVYSFTQNVFHVVPYQTEYIAESYTPFTIIFVLINSALVPALIEEFTFRGAILGIFRRYGDIGALFISTIMFSLVHRNFVQIPYTFMFGLGLGLTRIITNSIWPCILAHFINNAFAAAITFMPDSLATLSLMLQLGFFALFVVLGIISYIKLKNKGVFTALTKSYPPFVKSSGSDFCKALFAPMNILAFLALLVYAFTSFKAV